MVLHYCSKPANRMHIIYILRQHILVGSSESCLTIFVLKLWVCCIHEWFRAHRESTHHSVIGNACTQREIRMLRRHILMQHVYSCVPWRQRELCLLVYIYARFPWVLTRASFWPLLLFNFWLHCAESLEGNSMWSSPRYLSMAPRTAAPFLMLQIHIHMLIYTTHDPSTCILWIPTFWHAIGWHKYYQLLMGGLPIYMFIYPC